MNGSAVRPTTRGTAVNHVDRPSLPDDVQVQNVQQTRVYVFGDSDITEDEVNTDGYHTDGVPEMCELRARGSNRGASRPLTSEDSEPVYIERTVSEEDTLQSIALQFGCPVAELKRINNLIRDQDFYAKRIIKVPVKRHGLLTELIEEENKRQAQEAQRQKGSRSHTVLMSEPNEIDDDSDPESSVLLVRTISIRDHVTEQSKEAQDFLKTMDRDLDKIRKNTNTYKNSLQEVTTALTCKSIHPINRSCRSRYFNGQDCGMRWWSLAIVMLIIGLGTPLLYFLFYHFEHTNQQ